MIAYWLIPAPPAKDFLARQVAELAKRFDAPIFEPHVTVYVDDAFVEYSAPTLGLIAAECGSISLSIEGIRFSGEFTKTLFVQFRGSIALAQLNKAIQSRSIRGSDYPLNPHLSLLYKKMPDEQKAEIATAIHLPFGEVIFDTLTAVKIPRKVETPGDVAEWQTLARHSLKSPD